MAEHPDASSIAVFVDLENIAVGVNDAKYAMFDIGKVLERLLVKGNIVVRKAYCDWGRYREFKRPLHEASFELIEVPHVRQSGKNSADVRMVVDALDLCYTKPHVGTFVIASGDSDFSPLVSKLRENNKEVIGVGVKNSTSDLLIGICDQFILYDDLVRPKQTKRRRTGKAGSADKPTGSRPKRGKTATEDPQREALDLVVETAEALFTERGEEGLIWGSMVKQALKRRKPSFSESQYGFGSFSDLLEEARTRRLLDLTPDEKSGGFIVRGVLSEG